MEPILREHGTVEGFEILYFENAEVEKVKGNSVSFASMGTLSVLYFKSYDRFFLQLNDWRYPLLRRLPIVAERQPDGSRFYVLPAANGFSFKLNLGHVPSLPSLANFEKILYSYSNFSFRGEETPFRTSELSPEDNLVRGEKKDTGIKEVVSQKLKKGVEKAKVVMETVKTGTLHVDSKKRSVNLKEIRNRNFRRRAHSTFHKGFFEAGMKMTDQFVQERTCNENLRQEKSLAGLKIGYHLPRMYIHKEEVEDAIINYKEIALRGNIHLSGFTGQRQQQRGRPQQRGPGLVDSLKEGFREIKETFSEMLSGPHIDESAVQQGRVDRHQVPRQMDIQASKDVLQNEHDTLYHYSG